jgi:hypothetical protein
MYGIAHFCLVTGFGLMTAPFLQNGLEPGAHSAAVMRLVQAQGYTCSDVQGAGLGAVRFFLHWLCRCWVGTVSPQGNKDSSAEPPKAQY